MRTRASPHPRPAGSARPRRLTPWPLLGLCLGLWLPPQASLACQYSVRDIGFVDLESAAYRFYAFVSPETPADARALLQEMAGVALRDCNTQFELVPPGASTAHPAFRHLPGGADVRFPSAVLVSPDGQALPLALTQPDRPFRESLASVLGTVATSRKREELLAAASHHFAAVLLIEGEVSAANERARQAIARAIRSIQDRMRSMPKPIAQPPALVVLESAALAREEVLLWSLGLEPTPTAQPRAAIIYGRARWMGPLISGDEISEPNLTRLLAIIGADCECGLDVAWTLGTRLPVRWDEARHAQVAKALGFDPESPVVRLEVHRIARRSGSPATTPAANRAAVLASDPSSAPNGPPGGGTRPPSAVNLPRRAAAREAVPLTGNALLLSRAGALVAGMAVIALSTGLFLVWKARRRGPK